MRTFVIAFFALLITFQATSQDEIVLLKDSTIKAKVIEIGSDEIIIKILVGNEELIKYIGLKEVHKIVYENGTIEKFNEKPEVKTIDRILNRGFFINIIPSYGYFKSEYESDIYYNMKKQIIGVNANLVGAATSVGYNWFLGSNEKYRLGIEAIWVRLGLYTDGRLFVASLSPLNVGLINVIKLGELQGLTISVSSGLHLLIGEDDNHASNNVGYNFCADVKYRYKAFAIGISYLRMAGNDFKTVYRSRFNTLGLSIGLKF